MMILFGSQAMMRDCLVVPNWRLLDGGFRLALGTNFGANQTSGLLNDPRAV